MPYKKIKQRTRKTVRLNSFMRGIDNLKDDLQTSVDSAKECFNFDTSSGALTPLRGFSNIEVKPFTGFWAIFQNSGYSIIDGKKFYSMVMVDTSGKLMGCDYNDFGIMGEVYESPDEGFRFTSVPQMVEYKNEGADAMLFSSPTDGLVVWNGGTDFPQKIENAPLITSMALHGERLFVTVADRTDKVWFSQVFDPTKWEVSLSGAGYIGFSDERGECEKVITYGGYVYVFRSYGISRIKAYGDQSEFEVDHVFTSGSKILTSTVTLCSNRIVFATEDGLFSFNGSSVVKILPALTPSLEFSNNSASAFYKGKYYISCVLNGRKYVGCENGKFVNNCMLVYDLYSDAYVLYRGIDVRYIAPLTGVGKVYLVVGDSRGLCAMSETRLFGGELLTRKWKSPASDFGIAEKKTLKEILIYTDYDITLRVEGDSETKEIEIKGKLGRSRVPVNISSYTFSIEFISNDYDCRIASPTIVFY